MSNNNLNQNIKNISKAIKQCVIKSIKTGSELVVVNKSNNNKIINQINNRRLKTTSLLQIHIHILLMNRLKELVSTTTFTQEFIFGCLSLVLTHSIDQLWRLAHHIRPDSWMFYCNF